MIAWDFTTELNVLLWVVVTLIIVAPVFALLRRRTPINPRVHEPLSHVELKDARPYDWATEDNEDADLALPYPGDGTVPFHTEHWRD